ncbi:hypothetical protein BGZ72_009584 [Mortierella alpina]|nr:hypothetical protein BGZ72_009584 [Mortierella alpina]
MVSHISRRPRLILLLGTALYLPATLAAKVHIDPTSESAHANNLVVSDHKLQQSQHFSNLQQHAQTVAAVHKSKNKNSKKGEKKVRESAVDTKGTKAHKHKKTKDQGGLSDTNNNSDDNNDDNNNNNNDSNDEDSKDDQDDGDKRSDVNSYLADLWKGIVHLGKEPNIQAGIAALTSEIHGIAKKHGKRDVIQQQEAQDLQSQQKPSSDKGQRRQGEERPLAAPAVRPLLLRPNHHRLQKNSKQKTAKMDEEVEGLARPKENGGKTGGVHRGNAADDDSDSEAYDEKFGDDEGGLEKANLPKIGQRVVFGKDGQVVGLAVDVGPGHPIGHGVSEAERFVKYGNEIMGAAENMLTGHDLTEALTPAPHPFLVLEKRQKMGMLGTDAANGAVAAAATAESPQLEMDMGLKRIRPIQEPEMDRAMDGELQRKAKKDKGQEVDAGLQDYEKIAKKLRKQNDDAFQVFPAEEKKDKKADPLQKAFDKVFGAEETKEHKKQKADPFEVDVPKRHRNKDRVDDGFNNVPIEVQKEKKKEKHASKAGGGDKDFGGGGDPTHKDQNLGNGDLGKANDKDIGKNKQEPAPGAALDPGKGLDTNKANHPPDRTGPAPVSGSKKDSTTPGGFGTVPMFGPAQLDLGSGATISAALSTWTCAFAVAATLMVTLVNC